MAFNFLKKIKNIWNEYFGSCENCRDCLRLDGETEILLQNNNSRIRNSQNSDIENSEESSSGEKNTK